MCFSNRSIRLTTAQLAIATCFSLWGGSTVAQDTGAIAGRVLNSSNGRALPGASVDIVGSDDGRATTDLDGRFGIDDIPVGTYQVRISAPRYGSTVIEGVEVAAGKESPLRAALSPKGDSAVEVLEVVADVTESSEATQLLKRKMAPTVSDNLGAESISKTPDSDAAEVVTRVPSVTIKDGSFLIVRGLGDRYNAALMNRSRLPSTDPTRRVVPLDLFPADFIESLTLVKSYTPDLPGDFAGGLLDIRLSEPPLEPKASLGVSTSYNSSTTFDNFTTYDGCGARDWFGFGVGCRELPSGFPSKSELATIRARGTDLQQRAINGQLPRNWNFKSKTAPPNFGLDVGFGNTWGPFGLNLATTYATKHQTKKLVLVSLKSQSDFEQTRDDPYDYATSTFESELGTILTSKLDLSNDHQLKARLLYNRKSEDEVRSGVGRDESQGFPLAATSSIYTADQLIFGQVSSQHRLGPIEADLRAGVGLTTRDQPDGKLGRRQQADDGASFTFIPQNYSRFFGELDEMLQEYAADVTLPFTAPIPILGRWAGREKLIKAGGSYLFRDRDFHLRAFGYQDNGAITHFDQATVTPDEYFNPVNFGGDGVSLIESTTTETARFEATQEIAAGYMMLDIPLIADKLRLIGGARLEYSYIFIDGYILGAPVRRPIQDVAVLPAVNLVYSLSDATNLRFAYSGTVSRPEFRELNQSQIPTTPGQRPFRGNPDLLSTTIQNIDFRWEWFPTPLELISFGAFYKELDSPIETSALPGVVNVIETRTNALKAVVWGFEIEHRRNFNFLIPTLRQWEPIRPYVPFLADVEFVLNFTYVKSQATGLLPSPGFDTVIATNESRPLTDQAPYVLNAALQYDHFRWGTFRLLYNTVGETIVAVGTTFSESRLQDIKLQPRDQLDFVWLREWNVLGQRLKTKLSIENIANDDFLETQEVESVDKGVVTSLGTLTTKRYHTGVTVGLGLTYNF